MLVIEVQLLGGRYVATAFNDRTHVEWPPHPARLFSALVAALYDRRPHDDPREREALLAIERAGAPQIEASNVEPADEVGRRTVNDVFVPVNDVTVLDHDKLADLVEEVSQAAQAAQSADNSRQRATAEKRRRRAMAAVHKAVAAPREPSKTDLESAALLVDRRSSPQSRRFPSFSPDRDVFRLCWPGVQLESETSRALSSLLERVTRLGHSSSLVRCSLAQSAAPTLLPARDDEPSDWTLRVVGEGQLERLEAAFARHQGVHPRVLPSLPQRYRLTREPTEPALPAPAVGVFDSEGWVVLAAEGDSRMQATRCVDIAKALHRVLVALAPQPPPELICGRCADGRPSEHPHVAVVPLPDVGHQHAHGGVLGVAVILPREAREERNLVQRIMARWELEQPEDQQEPPQLLLRLHGGAAVRVRRVEDFALRGLRPGTWCRPARRWVTATPIALDRNPGNLRSRATAAVAAEEAKQFVRVACEHIGLPAPAGVEVSLAPILAGCAAVSGFEAFPREPGRLRRVKVHAELLFDQQVRGPVLLGAGRYVGLGLCRPVE